MRYLKRFAMLFSLLIVLYGASAIPAEAQRRVAVRRPVAVYHQPYWGGGFGWRYGGFGYDPYFYDPYLREQRDKYYAQQDVRDSRKELAKHQEKYYADGVITAKEQKELNENQKDYNKAVRKLNRYRDNY
jgi:hypothetical protein